MYSRKIAVAGLYIINNVFRFCCEERMENTTSLPLTLHLTQLKIQNSPERLQQTCINYNQVCCNNYKIYHEERRIRKCFPASDVKCWNETEWDRDRINSNSRWESIGSQLADTMVRWIFFFIGFIAFTLIEQRVSVRPQSR